MGCLSYLFEYFLLEALLPFLFPWLNPEPNDEVNVRLYGTLTLVVGAACIWCWFSASAVQIAGEALPILRTVAVICCAYFAVLTLCYWPRSR